jgi:hypothetical protein
MALRVLDLNAQCVSRKSTISCTDPRSLFLAAIQAVNEDVPPCYCMLGIHFEQDLSSKEWKVLSLCPHNSSNGDFMQHIFRGDILYEVHYIVHRNQKTKRFNETLFQIELNS